MTISVQIASNAGNVADAAVQAFAIQRTNHTGVQVIASVTDLQTSLDAKSPLASPTLTGVPAAPTAGAGTNTTQLATTAFVKTAGDAISAGINNGKDAVVAASTTDGTLATAFENGDTLDGVVLVTGDRILLKDQTSKLQSGIYEVQASGAPVRVTDMDTAAEVAFAEVLVLGGTVNAGTRWRVTGSTDSEVVAAAAFTAYGTDIGDTAIDTVFLRGDDTGVSYLIDSDVIRVCLDDTMRDASASDLATTDRNEFDNISVAAAVSGAPARGISFDLYIPTSMPAPDGSANVTLAQFRHAGVGTPAQLVWRVSDGSLSLRTEIGGSAYHLLLSSADNIQGRWHHFDIDGVWSDTAAGQLMVRVDGVEKWSLLNSANCDNGTSTIYAKFGLYRPDSDTSAREPLSVFFHGIQRRSTFAVGSDYANWVLQTEPIRFVQSSSGSTSYLAGTGLTLAGSTFSANAASDAQMRTGTATTVLGTPKGVAEAIEFRVAASPLDYGATGDGVTDDTANYTSAEAALDDVYLPGARTFNTDIYEPTKPVYGPGALLIDGITIAGMQLTYDAVHSNVIYAPTVYAHGSADGFYGLPPDTGTVAHFNVVIAPGWRKGLSPFPANAGIRRSTFVGAGSGLMLEEAERTESFGVNAHMFAKLSSRNSGFGSLTFAWLGQDVRTDSSGKMYAHPIFFDEILQVPYTDPTWNAGFVEDMSPGTRATVVAWADGGNWPTDRDLLDRNCAFGRDTLQSLIVGRENAAYGYRGLTLLIAGSRNVAIGCSSLFYSLFDSYNTAIGSFAAYSHLEGDTNFYGGYLAGYSHLKGHHNVILGPEAAYSANLATWEGSYNVFIGTDAAQDVDGNIAADMNNQFYLQNYYTRNPLISGDFEFNVVAINKPKANAERARLHLYDGASGLAIGTAISGSQSDLLIESDTHSGIGFLTPANMVQGLYFYEASATFRGSLVYDQSVDRFRIKCAAETNGAEFGAAGYFKMANLPTSSPGAGTKRFWVDTADSNRVKFAV